MDTEGLIGVRTGSRPLITGENCSEQGQDGWANIMEWPVLCRGSSWESWSPEEAECHAMAG